MQNKIIEKENRAHTTHLSQWDPVLRVTGYELSEVFGGGVRVVLMPVTEPVITFGEKTWVLRKTKNVDLGLLNHGDLFLSIV